MVSIESKTLTVEVEKKIIVIVDGGKGPKGDDGQDADNILTLSNYEALRNLTGYSQDIVNVANFTQDGKMYQGGIFRKISTGTDNGAYIIVNGSTIWSRDFDPTLGYLASWWGLDITGTVSNTTNIKTALVHIDSIGGGALMLPNGTINVTPMNDGEFGAISGIRVLENTTLKGQGAGTVINYVYDYVATSGTGIIVVGENSKVEDLTIKSNSFVAAKGIAIGVSTSADNCIVNNVVFKNWGGYNVHLAGEASTSNNYCENALVSNCVFYDVTDTAIEFSTAKNCVVTNCVINYRGRTGGGNSWGISFYAGSENNTVTNIVMQRQSGYSGVFAAIGFQSDSTSNTNGYFTQNNRVSNVVAKDVDIALDLKNGLSGATHNPINILVSSCTFVGNGLSTSRTIQLSRCKDVEISNCTFENFGETTMDSPSLVSNQRQSSNININNCKFINTGEFNLYGIEVLNFTHNVITNNGSTSGFIVKLWGVTNSQFIGNQFKDSGEGANTNAFFISDNSGSTTNICQYLVFIGNIATDIRATKWLFRVLILSGGASNIKSAHNYLNGKSGGAVYLDVSTGSANSNLNFS